MGDLAPSGLKHRWTLMAKRRWFFAFLPALFACEGTSASEGAIEPPTSLAQGAADSPYATRQVRERGPRAEDVTRWDEPEAEQDLNPGPETSSVSREATEDAFIYECEPGEVEPCVTQCGTMGTRSCGKRWGPCLPPEEVCDQADDDCDGLIDEGVANPCGGCGMPPVEVCDGSDNDCDGFIDEGVANACGACGDTPTSYAIRWTMTAMGSSMRGRPTYAVSVERSPWSNATAQTTTAMAPLTRAP